MSRHITLLGAGLTGPLLAIYLAKRGYTVDVYERRPDMRVEDIGGGRSINLALSLRGINGMDKVGVADEVMKDAIRMKGRMIHDLEGNTELQPYDRQGRAINSISRGGLNMSLMDAAERYENVTFHFNARCSDVDLEGKSITLVNDKTGEERQGEVDLLISSEGANSSLRKAFEEKVPGFDSRTDWLSHGYKELSIPPGPNGEFLIEKNALHIWPRHDFMMIALPNPDGTFTCTLFAPWEGEDGFDAITTDDDVRAYFDKHFPDAVPLMPTLIEDWNSNPTAKLGTVYCSPWHYQDWALLIGDAAHAIVPFYGQGMNACFEDCVVLDGVMEEYGDDWGKIVSEFSRIRKPDGDAIASLAITNFLEMRSKVVDPKFLRKKKIDAALNEMFPEKWIPLYTMVTFSNIPYSEAKKRAAEQNQLLDTIGYDTVEAAIAEGEEKTHEVLWGE